VEQQDPPPANSRRWRQVAAVALAIFVAVISLGYAFKLGWVGVVDFKDATYKTLWDWLTILMIPAVLGVGSYLFTRSENRRTQRIADQQRNVDLKIAEERRQDDMLQAYLDVMSSLLTDKDRPLHRAQRDDSLSTVARARTLTVLSRLDSERKSSVLQFLYESALIAEERTADKYRAVLDLSGADLRGANLVQASLDQANLSKTDLSEATLSGAHLFMATLSEVNLGGAFLGGAFLVYANLRDANLRDANLQNADLGNAGLGNADLSGANLREADLNAANLGGAILREADLSRAKLMGAKLYSADLRGANLRGASLGRSSMGGIGLSGDVWEVSGVDLSGTDLREADLREADLNDADLGGADLRGADLRGANLRNADLGRAWRRGDSLNQVEADLSGANLRGAVLTNAKVTEGQLDQAHALTGATMPDGQKYEDWLKSKGSGDDGKNSGPS
jgi:uncharacterized protein YjbI with pentapeptide repeats